MPRRFTTPIAIFGGLTLIITLFLIVPTIRDIRRLNAQIMDERARLEARYAKRHTVRKAIEFVETIRAQLPVLREVALEEGHEIDLVSAVENIAAETGVVHTIRLIPAADSSKKGYDRRLEIEIDAHGDGRALGRFFEEIEHLPVAFFDQTLTISRPNDGSSAFALWRGTASWPEPK